MHELIEIRQCFAIKPQRLFSLLSTPKYMQQWFSPDPAIKVEVLQHEFYEQGHYHLRYTQPDTSQQDVKGTFLQIHAPTHICFSWIWQQPDQHAQHNTLVTWRLAAIDNTTELLVVHERLPDMAFYQRHHAGWLGTLQRLQQLATNRV